MSGIEPRKSGRLQGTLHLLGLKTLVPGALHGYGTAQKILIPSRETLDVQQGALYPALHRLERKVDASRPYALCSSVVLSTRAR